MQRSEFDSVTELQYDESDIGVLELGKLDSAIELNPKPTIPTKVSHD